MEKISTILGMILLIGSISALELNLIAGESTEIDLGEVYSYYSIIGNQTNIDLEVNQIGTIVNMTLSKYNPLDNFEIIFFNQEQEIINHYSGSSRTKIIKEVEYKTIPYYINNSQEETNQKPEEYEFEENVETENKFGIWEFFLGVIITLGIATLIYEIYSFIKKMKNGIKNT